MFTVTLSEKNRHQSFDRPVTVQEALFAFDPQVAKEALAVKISYPTQNESSRVSSTSRLVDLSSLLDQDIILSVVTENTPEGLEVLRHSCAHLLAQAVQIVFPKAQVTIGPVIEDGFYYDFAFHRPFTPEDIQQIESQMHTLAKQALPVTRTVLSRPEAIELFEKKGEQYKVEIIHSIPGEEPLSFYQQGDFMDLCRGPHVPNTRKLKAFKITKLAGAYWRGDVKNAMLQRVYGTAWATQADLDAYLYRLEEAEKRDHRKLGKKFDLFHLQEEGPGMVFWHPKGWAMYQVIEQYMRGILSQHGYQEVRTPQILSRTLWEKSGHWAQFQEGMFTLKADERDYAIKPMNCPGHVQIFNQGLKSYRDLPLRLAEFGSCHRNEPSGSLHGLFRVRGFVQDDAHIFCTEEQIQSEVVAFHALFFEIYTRFQFKDIIVKLSTRPAQRLGTDALWDKAEAALERALKHSGLPWSIAAGEGAFYGPKIDYGRRDSLGRVWACGTLQVDFSMPERLGAQYVAEDGTRRTPVMLHRAVLGSLERFIGILIEETAGSFPFWLAPIQIMVMNISDSQATYAQTVIEKLQAQGYRVQGDLRNEKIGFKIREHTLQKVPYLVILGDREVADKLVAVRTREGENLGSMAFVEFLNTLSHMKQE